MTGFAYLYTTHHGVTMKLNRRKLRRLIESTIYEQGIPKPKDGPKAEFGKGIPKPPPAKIDFKDKKQLVAAAGALHSAMFGGILGLGTDEETIGRIFSALEGNKAYLTALENNYKRIFQSDLMKDLRSEMSGEEIIKFIESEFPGAMS